MGGWVQEEQKKIKELARCQEWGESKKRPARRLSEHSLLTPRT